MRSKSLPPKSSATTRAQSAVVRRGRVIALDEQGQVFVSAAGMAKPAPAIVSTAVHSSEIRAAMDAQREALLAFEDGDFTKPVILAFVRAPDELAGAGGRGLSCIDAD